MRDALLERRNEIERVENVLVDALSGSGRCLAVTGPAGIGKTALLRAAIDPGRASAFRVGNAIGGVLERDHPFGAARDLLGSAMRSVPAEAKATMFNGAAAAAGELLGFSSAPKYSPAGDFGALLHGLYWLVANLAEVGPLLLVADDAHWFDAPTLRFLSYLARRLDGLPVALLVASRPAGSGAEGELVDALFWDPAVERIELARLSSGGVAAMVRDQMAVDADAGFCDACAAAGGGNPFLTLELIRGLRAADVQPVAAQASSVVAVGGARAGGVIVRRLHGLPGPGLELARSVAVLGHDASLPVAARLAGLDPAAAVGIADLLARSEILAGGDPLRFAHPLLAAAVYEGIPRARRSQDHARAARLLHDIDHDPIRPAAQLLAAVPAGDPWVGSVLLDAGRRAMTTGAPETAARLLDRALAEPPPKTQRVDVLRALGDAERALNWSTGVDHLREALQLASSPQQSLEIVMLLRSALVGQGRFGDAVAALEDVLSRALDREQRMRLEAAIVQTAFGDLNEVAGIGEHCRQLRAYLADGGSVPADVLGVGALALALLHEPAEAASDLAYQSLSQQRQQHARPVAPWCALPLWTLVMCEHPEAESTLTWFANQAGRQGEVFQQGLALLNRGWDRLRRGDLAGAESDAATSLEILSLGRLSSVVPESVAILAHVLIEQEAHGQAAALLTEYGFDRPLPGGDLALVFVLRARGLVHLAAGRTDEAIRDLSECGTRCHSLHSLPGFMPWRSELAVALAATGETAKARTLAAHEVDLAATFGAPRALGVALRGLGVVTRDQAVLAEAVAVLEHARGPLDLGRALVDLGALARAGGDRGRARGLLASGLDLAMRCGSVLLEHRARAELVLAGARIRRTAVSGPASLTTSELRVAGLAAEGHTNKAIAQSTFVGIKTVETQLAAAYRKLGIASRTELAHALSA